MAPSVKRTRWTLSAVVAAFCLLNLLTLPSVGAQEDDDCYPDGCSPPTNPEPSGDVNCVLSRSEAASGDTVRGRVGPVAADEPVTIRFDGETVAERDTSDPSSNASQWNFAFEVPQRPPGEYSVVAVGTDFSVECGTANGDQPLQVLGDDEERDDGDGEPGEQVDGEPGGQVKGEMSDRGGSLPITGGQTVLLVVAAVLLLASGIWLTKSAKRRRFAGR